MFPPFLLGANDLVRLWTRRGINDRANFYWDSTGAIWNNSGDTAILQDASGKQVSSYSFGPPPSAPAAPEPSAPTMPTPAPEIDNLEDAVAAGQVQPFSLADLGLSEEEIAALGLGEPAAPEAPATPAPEIDNLEDAVAAGQVQPFSLADLGLSEEEIAALDLGEPAAAGSAAAHPHRRSTTWKMPWPPARCSPSRWPISAFPKKRSPLLAWEKRPRRKRRPAIRVSWDNSCG